MTDIKMIGFGGVDIFMFASGIGCYYSLEKDDDCFNFIKRRIMRIIPTYWIFLIVWTIYKVNCSEISWNAILGNFLCVRNFTGLGGDFNWYISAIWLMYFLAPFLKGVVDKIDCAYKFFVGVVLLFLLTICFWDSTTYIITISRIPIFFIGMCIGKNAAEDCWIRKGEMGVLMILAVAGLELLFYFQKNYPDYLWNRAYYWYPFILIVPGLCIMISAFMEVLKKCAKRTGGIVEYILGITGKFSFEIYLIHVLIFEIMKKNLKVIGMVEYKRSVWVMAILLLIPACLLLHWLSKISTDR